MAPNENEFKEGRTIVTVTTTGLATEASSILRSNGASRVNVPQEARSL